jgi:hypothetical protein
MSTGTLLDDGGRINMRANLAYSRAGQVTPQDTGRPKPRPVREAWFLRAGFLSMG